MCGRFVQFSPASLLSEIYKLESVTDSANEQLPNYNVTPETQVTAIVKHGDKRVLDTLKWGFLPKWAVGSTAIRSVINAVSETVYEKKFFINAIKNSRCIVPMDGFYEWSKQPGSSAKIPYYFSSRQKSPFAVAGIYEEIEDKSNGRTSVNCCAVLTCQANDVVQNIHSRMPMIIKNEFVDQWLENGELDRILFNQFSRPIQSDFLEAHEVSKAVNSPKNNDENLIHGIKAMPQ